MQIDRQIEDNLMREARQNIVRCVVLEMISQPALQFLHALFEPPAQAIPEAFFADFLWRL